MENLGDRTQTLGVGGETLGHNHELLEINRSVGMRAAIDDVRHGDRQHFGVGSAEIFEERDANGLGGGFGIGEGNGQNGVRTKLGLGFCAVEFEHDAVHGQLVEGIDTLQRGENFFGHIFDRLADALAVVALFVAVAHFEGFMLAGARAGRNGRAVGLRRPPKSHRPRRWGCRVSR